MPVQPVTVSSQQHLLNAIRSVERAQLQVQRIHGQVTPRFLRQLAILQGITAQLARITGPA